MNDALFSANKADWCTPEPIIRLLDSLGGVALDPCTNAASRVQASVRWTKEDDALQWSGRDWARVARSCAAQRPGKIDGLIYCNPPYGRGMRPFLDRCVEAGEITSVMALIPARTDTRAWHDTVDRAQLVAFWRGRLRFETPASPTPDRRPSSAPFPSALVFWSPKAYHVEEVAEVLSDHALVTKNFWM